ncbi:MAG: extracellular solute-binding protein [Nocardioidaceae bacterium]|nr:extracellular solute-binding protein [Nocardioidaceae bacterium]NUS51095.1 extracellular solute-binding protein [Nocardioidaceae bacterium]
MSRPAPRRRVAAVLLATAALALAACSAPGSNDSSAPKTKAPSEVSTDVAKAGKVTLRVWDQEVRGGQNAQMTKLNQQFMDAYPNVTIKRTSKSFTDLKTTLKLALSGDTAPDVVEVNQGYPDMVSFVKAGYLQPLDSYASVYKWADRYPSSLLDLNRVSDDASHFGEGKLYGLSQMGEFVGVYYNKTKLKQLGIAPPTTWDEFTTALAKAKQGGQVPIQFGNLDKWPAIHTFGVIQDQLAGKDEVRNLVFGKGGASWTDPKTVEAAKTLQDWAKRGYFPSGVNGVGYDDSTKQFGQGKGVFLVTGTWAAADLKGPMGDALGMMPPPSASGSDPVTTGGQSLALGVTSKSAHPDVAAAYVNFMTDAKAAGVMQDTGNLPAVPATDAASQASGVDADILDGWSSLNQDNGLVPYLDYSTPTFYDTLTAALQRLIGGQDSPEEFAKTLQADYEKFQQG